MPYVTGKRLGSKRRAFVGIKHRRTDGPNPTFGSFISWSRCNARRGRRIQVIRADIPLVHTLPFAQINRTRSMGSALIATRNCSAFCVAPRVRETIHSYDDQPLAGLQARVPISRRTAFAFDFSPGATTGAAGSAAIRSTIAAANPATGPATSKQHASSGTDSERPKKRSGSDFTER